MHRYLITSICAWFLLSCSWFCSWVIAYYFVNDPELAILFFPFALRLGITLHTPKYYWPAIYAAEWWLTVALAILMDQPQWLTVLAASAASIPLIAVAQRYYYGSQQRRLSVMGVIIVLSALTNTLAVSHHDIAASMVALVSITAGLMMVPSCYLVWNYLFQSTWIPLTANLVSRHIEFRARHIVFYSLLFALSIALQIGLPDELRRFAPFCLAIPIILLAFRYGWQGALLGTLLNSIALIAARSGVSGIEITDLLLSLSAQSLTGITLGMAVQHQRDLNTKLRQELDRNQNLSRQLVKAEESVRRDIARELHDEIGQNITAIRTQASIIQRVETEPVTTHCANTIEALSLNVYDTTKGLLTRLRPKTLDDLGLEEAIEQLLRDLEFNAHGVQTHVEWCDNSALKLKALSDATKVTLYRLCQEALNNALKYAQAEHIHIHFSLGSSVTLHITDDGIGLKAEDHLKGFGLRGMRERVQALGGQFQLHSECKQSNVSTHGTRLTVILPNL
ncbi:signal transduction histidine-protein kinase/phosphatase UhpB [Vibrio aestuarianus]|uniref:Sensory histidine kinase UhpB n=1 Tax=Vibrio aestuarianus TaxID=28171 RepID=A0ABN8TIZ0_9VIBR|nr:signal transduction histidine-protein kinase/phosphatase UhpB [Vibrio aestuarianus]MDE1228995.1 signal transduction histidine-protein kinase/phosphatase UhpB [Vibrio aestuarianus]MDE1258217.1 signal transduction histidine-protein kinase/phosphatase UhpB [Vibrio aestuarianus]MDE1273073.1 signal transduction histidine-protein kinase/phosphatase UhpB [Vibrio aestuarianus]MDE1292928.1 signal transduction histidine-protein kinase/phosphatase UhpB [Vibrio aestuarianus]MDE1308549.1 signal transduc